MYVVSLHKTKPFTNIKSLWIQTWRYIRSVSFRFLWQKYRLFMICVGLFACFFFLLVNSKNNIIMWNNEIRNDMYSLSKMFVVQLEFCELFFRVKLLIAIFIRPLIVSLYVIIVTKTSHASISQPLILLFLKYIHHSCNCRFICKIIDLNIV